MVFSSYVFILAFLPVTVIVYYLLSHVNNSLVQRLFLIAASLFFYGYYNVRYLVLILASIVVNYVLAVGIQRSEGKKAKLFFVLGILFNVGLIGYYKYYDFFVENINAVFGSSFALKHILLPLGISFFTFQQLSFLVSVYKGEEHVEQLKDYCLFVSFFPQLVAGPIVLYSEMIPQFKDEKRRYFDADNFATGIYMFSIGLFKKAAVADTLAFFADAGFGMTDLGMAAGWLTSVSYTLQIFFDFSGYSDMAIGLGKLFNIDIPMNFWKPYESESISEYWRRWHMTLGRALSTYVYRPLGGNRKGLKRTCVNLFVTFVVSGLWHGAAWTYVVWGALHGALVVCERLLKEKLEKIPHRVRVAATFLILNLLFVIFRSENFGMAAEVYKGMFNFGNLSGLQELVRATSSFVESAINLALVAVFIPVMMKLNCVSPKAEDFRPSRRTMVQAVAFFSIAFLCLSRESVFIYFNF